MSKNSSIAARFPADCAAPAAGCERYLDDRTPISGSFSGRCVQDPPHLRRGVRCPRLAAHSLPARFPACPAGPACCGPRDLGRSHAIFGGNASKIPEPAARGLLARPAVGCPVPGLRGARCPGQRDLGRSHAIFGGNASKISCSCAQGLRRAAVPCLPGARCWATPAEKWPDYSCCNHRLTPPFRGQPAHHRKCRARHPTALRSRRRSGRGHSCTGQGKRETDSVPAGVTVRTPRGPSQTRP